MLKRISFLMVSLLFSSYAVGQQPPSNKVVNASLPKGSEKLTKEQLSDYVQAHFKKSGIPYK